MNASAAQITASPVSAKSTRVEGISPGPVAVAGAVYSRAANVEHIAVIG
jgi:hypothetical protein